MRYTVRFISLLVYTFFLAAACKGAPSDPKRKEALDAVTTHFANASKKMLDAEKCKNKVDEAKKHLNDKTEDIAKLLKDYSDFPNASETSALDKALKPGLDNVTACLAELKKDQKKNKKEIQEIESDLKDLVNRKEKIKDIAAQIKVEEEAKTKRLAQEKAAEEADAKRLAQEKAAADKAAADKAAADKAAADKAAADKAAADKAAADAAANPPPR
jgi:chromosome segregation ATPase